MTATGPAWADLPLHHAWLRRECDRLLAFHERHAFAPGVGATPLGLQGEPLDADRDLYSTARQAHCFAIAALLGRPGAANIARRALDALAGPFEDSENGGWYTTLTAGGTVVDTSKSAYPHAFVLLAASSAVQAGIPTAPELLSRAAAVIEQYFWQEAEGASAEHFTAGWDALEPGYRGQNANMHLTEAMMAAYEATGRDKFLRRAIRIADTIINHHARDHQWRVPEHFDGAWRVVADYNIDKPADPFRPYGSVPGHGLEWARLVLQLHALDAASTPWAPDAARNLFAEATAHGWDASRGGIVYTVDPEGRPVNTARMHWGIAEAIGAASWLYGTTHDAMYDDWYRRFWDYTARHVIDNAGGSWWHEIDAEGTPSLTTWGNKIDLYHAYQATLYARSGYRHGLAESARLGLTT